MSLRGSSHFCSASTAREDCGIHRMSEEVCFSTLSHVLPTCHTPILRVYIYHRHVFSCRSRTHEIAWRTCRRGLATAPTAARSKLLPHMDPFLPEATPQFFSTCHTPILLHMSHPVLSHLSHASCFDMSHAVFPTRDTPPFVALCHTPATPALPPPPGT